MKPQTIKILYRILLVLFCLFFLADAAGGLMMQEEGIKAMTELGYPLYLMPFLGILKILGVIALLIPGYYKVKEWAFAGFAFSMIGAFWSWSNVGNQVNLLFPVAMLMLLFLIYYLWRKIQRQEKIAY